MKRAPTEDGCLARFELLSSASVLAEQRWRGPHHPDFFVRYRAEAITPAHTPLAALARFALEERPVFHLTPDGSEVVVDARFASDLEAIDVPRLCAGERRRVGRLTPRALAALGGRELLELLLRSDVLRTYWHTGSELRLCTERMGPGGAYRAELEGSHTYFTTKRHRRALAFAVSWADNGEIEVEGIAPPHGPPPAPPGPA